MVTFKQLSETRRYFNFKRNKFGQFYLLSRLQTSASNFKENSELNLWIGNETLYKPILFTFHFKEIEEEKRYKKLYYIQKDEFEEVWYSDVLDGFLSVVLWGCWQTSWMFDVKFCREVNGGRSLLDSL